MRFSNSATSFDCFAETAAYQQFESLIETRPEKFDELQRVFVSLNGLENFCSTHQARNARETLLLQNIRKGLDMVYEEYLKTSEPLFEVVLHLQQQAKVLLKEANPDPKLNKVLSFFGVRSSRFVDELDTALKPVMRLNSN